MSTNIKELLVVLAIALAAFALAKPVMLRFCDAQDFARRRNIWLLLTATAFLSPNFWLFALVAVPALAWGGRKDSNPVALYLLLMQLIPSTPKPIPTIGINALFDLDLYRLLSLCVLIPAAWRLRRSADFSQLRRWEAMDYLLLGYGVLQIIFYVRPDLNDSVLLQDSLSNALRRGFLFFVDIYVLYYVVSRFCSSRAQMVEALAAFCLASVIMASIAAFEGAWRWLLYSDIVTRWSPGVGLQYYLYRGGTLRAVASAGHPLSLGYLLAVGLGFWLYLRQGAKWLATRVVVSLVICAGLLATYSRGPWLGAAVIVLAFAVQGMKTPSRLLKTALGALIVIGAVLATPVGDRIISVLPFLGGPVATGSIVYRQRLIAESLELIREHPLFGDQFFYSQLQSMRQGEGIIDVVNTYVEVALSYGLIGLTLFISFMLFGLFKVMSSLRRVARADPDLSLLGASIAACIIGTIVMIGTCSFIGGYQQMFYVLAGFATAYTKLAVRRQAQVATRPAVRIRSPGRATVGNFRAG